VEAVKEAKRGKGRPKKTGGRASQSSWSKQMGGPRGGLGAEVSCWGAARGQTGGNGSHK